MDNSLFLEHINLDAVFEVVQSQGYHFETNVLRSDVLAELVREASTLKFELGDHVQHPINKNSKNQVQQLHERFYCFIDNPLVPFTSNFCKSLASIVSQCNIEFKDWLPTEIGFQRYRGSTDWISPHRDRRSDKLLSITITLDGSAWINIYKSTVEPPDYKKLEKVDSSLTQPGTVMFLRAPGFGNGEQVIHEVSPPVSGSRLILNLRMRYALLKSPKETHYE